MALIACRECQREMSSEAPACPHCGAPSMRVPSAGTATVAPITLPPKRNRARLWVLVGIAVALLGIVKVGNIISEARKTPEQRAAEAEGARVRAAEQRERDRQEELRREVRWTLPSLCQTAVRNRLKAPSTADFPSDQEEIRWNATEPVASVIGAVDAQNSFGAKIRTRYVCQARRDGAGKWTVTGVAIAK